MSNVDFDKLFDTLKEEITNLALKTFKEYKNEAKKDASDIMDKLKDNLKDWTQQVAKGEMSKKDLEFLLLGQKEVIEMNALKQVGLSMIKIDQFQHSLLKLIADTVSKLI